ncbi:unnamed protein product [Cuscuta epithymum]|uniref:S-protein homolog n=1 Tax=Cuscuta epithymum TaxID=186058 RepID=A0AAV0D420_9ASTE|nr:unnamed protein product [Cuscuta epithymum]
MVTKIWVVLAALSLVLSAANSSSLEKYPVAHFLNRIDNETVSIDCSEGGSTKLEPVQKFSFEAKDKDNDDAYICYCEYGERPYSLEVKGYQQARDKGYDIYWMFVRLGIAASYDNKYYTLVERWKSD